FSQWLADWYPNCRTLLGGPHDARPGKASPHYCRRLPMSPWLLERLIEKWRKDMNRQNQIKMTPEEQAEFLARARTMMLCTIDKDGYPHAVAMAYMVKDGCIYMTSFRKAQKVVNIRRNPKVAVMVESGMAYNELKGVMIRGRCEIIDDPDEVWKVMREI